LNAILPGDIRVLDVAEAPPDFHARFSARSKSYRYQLRTSEVSNPFTRAFEWQLSERLDVDRMRAAAASLVGTHDFAAFQSAGTDVTSSIRTILRSEIRGPEGSAPLLVGHQSSISQSGTDPLISQSGADPLGPRSVLVYEVTADGFLRHMVRAIVGTLVEIGRGWRPVASVTQLLDGGTRADAGATAPPHGLFLVRVDYD
jgi:tRNA pseudouridine38-40 synthase